MVTINYKMIGKLDNGAWASWMAINSPDYEGDLYAGVGNLIINTIQVSARYYNMIDYDYSMIGKLDNGSWASWLSSGSPDYDGSLYTGGGVLVNDTIQVSSLIYVATPTPPVPTFNNVYSTYFDGATEYVQIGSPYSFEYTDPFSISGWFKTTDATGYLLSKANATPRGYGLVLDAGRPKMGLFNTIATKDEIATVAAFNDGYWHHVVGINDGNGDVTGMSIYVDGNLEPVTTITNLLGTNTIVSTGGDVNIGGRSNGSILFNADIDEVSLWDKALTVGDVAEIFNGGAPNDLSSHSSKSNLVGWWRMGDSDVAPTINDYLDYNVPTMPDLSININNGTMTNMDVTNITIDAPYGKCVNFGGTNEYVKMGDVLGFARTDSFSISCWFKGTAENVYLVSKVASTPRGYGLLVDSSGRIQFVLANSGTIRADGRSTRTVSNNAWHHVLVTYDGSSVVAGMTCYIDGVLDALSATTDNLAANTIINTAEFNVASRTNGSVVYTGKIDEVAVWNKELSSVEAAEVYNDKVLPVSMTSLSSAANLVGWWKMGEGDVNPTLTDFSTGGHNGTMVNMEDLDITDRVPFLDVAKSISSIYFDGAAEYITMGDILDFDNANGDVCSISAWVKTTDVSGYIVSKMSGAPFIGYGIYVNVSGQIAMIWTNDGNEIEVRTTVTVHNGLWHHVVTTYSGSQAASGVVIYIDGVAVALTTVDNTLGAAATTNAASFNINGRTNGSLLLTATIDEVSVWNKVLSGPEVTTIYNSGVPTELSGSANLVGYWKMGDGIGFNGTMINMDAGNFTTDVP